ncbi:hypothetical protein C8R43DRAFT_956176 [Mycena crocata]|nr:hypothetical protein C8R43DRAFT_956176 [Mycena crocata]
MARPVLWRKKRRRGDADHREHLRARKFWERYGKEAYYGFYHPQYKTPRQKALTWALLWAGRASRIEEGKERAGETEAGEEQGEQEGQGWKSQKKYSAYPILDPAQISPRPGTGWLYLRNQSRANINRFSSCLHFPMADSRPTDMEFFPDSRNFDSQKEHDESKRKMYFVVPHMGIFTLLNEALNWEENHSQDGVIPALTMKQALKILDSHTKPPKVKKEVKTEPEIKPEPAELKRGVDTPSPKRPLYTDDEDDEDEDADRVAQPVDTFEDHNHASRQKEVAQDGSQPRPRGKPALRGKRARAGPGPSSPSRAPTPARGPRRNPTAEPPAISPTISSVSSLSTGSSIPGSASTASHAFRNLGESASTARRGGVRASNPRAAVPARTSPPATRPSRRGSTVPHAAAPPSARHDPTVHVGPGAAAALRSLASGEPMKYKPVELKDLVEGAASASTSSSAAGERARLLWNHAQRTVYKDTAMAVQEMQPKETVQVVDLEDLVEYVSGKAPAVGSSSAAR